MLRGVSAGSPTPRRKLTPELHSCQIAQLDKEDESLAKWKASLGIGAGAAAGAAGAFASSSRRRDRRLERERGE